MTPELDLARVEEWLHFLHGDCPGYSVVSSPLSWTGRAVQAQSDSWPSDLLHYVQTLDNQGVPGIYLRITTVGTPPLVGRRGSDGDSVSLPALWLDMDIAGPGHKPIKPTSANPNPLPLPPDEMTCAAILGQVPDLPSPTLWIHSGGGMYPMWFFKQPQALSSPEEIEQWGKWSQGLHEQVHEVAKDMGWHYGTGTHDMSRVLRIPGTVNRKVPGDHKLAQQVWAEFGGHTFEPSELMFDMPAKPEPVREQIAISSPPTSPSSASSPAGVRPGDDFNGRGDTLGLLTRHGWEIHSKRGAEWFLTRPGKDRRDGFSASLGYEGSPNLYVWSTDAGLPVQEALSPFYLFAHYECGGDFKAAAIELGKLGYGDPLTPSTPYDPFAAQQANVASIVGTPSQGSGQIDIPATPSTPSAPHDSDPDGLSQPQSAVHRSDHQVSWVDMRDERQACLDITKELGAGNTSALFTFNGDLVYVPSCEEGGRFKTTGKVVQDGVYSIDAVAFRAFLYDRFRFVRFDKDGKAHKTMPSAILAASIRGALKSGFADTQVRQLRGVTRRPIIRPDGSICDTPGFDATTGMAYWPDPDLIIPEIPTTPNEDQLKMARDIILTMTQDFPFVSTNDFHNYVGFLLTPLLFNVVSTPIKLGIIGAHQPGSGKTLLANILQKVHGGTLMPGIKSGTDEEIRKQVSANLRDAVNPVCLWDNVSGTLNSATLDALLTSRTWRDRVLGQTRMVDMANDRMWLITGNNLQVGSDLSRRVTWCMINPNMPNPESRTNFTIPNLPAWVEENKGVILWALYTLVQAWSREGQPVWCPRSDLFCDWAGAINGILKVGGFEGEFDSTQSRQQGESTMASEWGAFFEAAHSQFGEAGWTIAQVLGKINTSTLPDSVTNLDRPLSSDILPIDLVREFYAGNTAWVARTIGIRMSSLVNSFCGGFQLLKLEKKTRIGIMWGVVPVGAPTADPGNGRGPDTAAAMPPDVRNWVRRNGKDHAGQGSGSIMAKIEASLRQAVSNDVPPHRDAELPNSNGSAHAYVPAFSADPVPDVDGSLDLLSPVKH